MTRRRLITALVVVALAIALGAGWFISTRAARTTVATATASVEAPAAP